MTTDSFGLPRDLGGGLLLRWATAADTEAIAAFNAAVHSDIPGEPDQGIDIWTRDLMSGRHPTVSPSDFTVVVDQNEGHKIVSTLNLISQVWRYEDIPFGVGRPELVGTLPEYRRRGLVRAQMDAVHAKSAARGELVQAITGIPWYYRLFGYEMTMNLGGSRLYVWHFRGNNKEEYKGEYRMRRATVDDIPVLSQLYEVHAAVSPLACVRDEAIWQHQLAGHSAGSVHHRQYWLVETAAGAPFGYFSLFLWKQVMSIEEMAVMPANSWRALGLYVGQALKEMADEINETAEKPIRALIYRLGDEHPVYEALGRNLERQDRPYAWYLRVPNLEAFLRHITPALERRLAASVMANHTGVLKLSFYQRHLKLTLERGKIVEIAPYEPESFFDANVFFPDQTFLHVLFGHRSLAELNHVRTDCFAEDAGSEVLLNCLFPVRHSSLFPVS